MNEMTLKIYFANLNTVIHNVLNFHWNGTGGLFLTLHKLTNEQASYLYESIDKCAELMKELGFYPLTCLRTIYDLATIKTMDSMDYSAREIIEMEIDQFENMKRLALNLSENSEADAQLFFTQQAMYFGKQIYFLRQTLKP